MMLGVARDPRHAAVRRLRERVPDPHHGDARTAVGHAVPAARARRRVRVGLRPRAADGVRRHDGASALRAPAGAAAGVRPSRPRADAGPLYPALSRGWYSPGGAPCSEADTCGSPDSSSTSIACRRRCRSGARSVDADAWQVAARAVAAAGGRLVSLWGADRRWREAGGFAVCAAYALADGLAWLELPLDADAPAYPDLSAHVSVRGTHAARRSRPARASSRSAHATRGRGSTTAPGPRTAFRLHEHDARAVRSANARRRPTIPSSASRATASTRSPVGPVHAGIIEPGHFRFSVVGEKVLRLEERLGYAHKGIERRFTELAPLDAHRLAGRVSRRFDGRLRVGLLHGARSRRGGATIPPRAPLAAGAAARARARRQPPRRPRRARQRRRVRRSAWRSSRACGRTGCALSNEVFGHRLMMDCIVPGGVASDLDGAARAAMRRAVRRDRSARSRSCARSTTSTPGLQDRFMGTGHVSAELAARARPDRARGARQRPGDATCASITPGRPTTTLGGDAQRRHRAGDVAARVAVRFDELLESLRLIRALLAALPAGEHRSAVACPPARRVGVGWVEGWRGEVFVALELDGAGGHRIRRCHCHDPVVAELAGARARGHRQHRSRLPADQQVVQPQLLGTRPVMLARS